MNDGFELPVAEKTFHPIFICQIKREEPESRSYAQPPQPRIFEPGVVIVVQVVYTYYLKPIFKKPADDMCANETSGTGNKNALVFYLFHHSSLSLTASDLGSHAVPTYLFHP
jgi:hypothetical protein